MLQPTTHHCPEWSVFGFLAVSQQLIPQLVLALTGGTYNRYTSVHSATNVDVWLSVNEDLYLLGILLDDLHQDLAPSFAQCTPTEFLMEGIKSRHGLHETDKLKMNHATDAPTY